MAKVTFEDNMAKLQKIVHTLESGNTPLDSSLSNFKTGIQLTNQLQSTLQNAKHTLAKVVNNKGQEVPYDRDKNGHDEDDDTKDPFAKDKR